VTAPIGVILGSGLGAVADVVEHARRERFAELTGFPPATVDGHRGTVVSGVVDGAPVIVFVGRLHLYESGSAALATLPIRLLHDRGARTVLLTNAAGGIRPTLEAGALMLITHQLDFTFRSPLVEDGRGGRDAGRRCSGPYDPFVASQLERAASSADIPIASGVYAAVTGPSYETRAEVGMLRLAGADAVGMSTAPEATLASALGMRVGGISCVTNVLTSPDAPAARAPLTHEDVLASSSRAATRLAALLRAAIPMLA
jgi:purine-nucleoside phosphorylase